MQIIWYYAAVALAKTLRALPLALVAGLGRAGGRAAYWLDFRHRRVAMTNLRRCFSCEPEVGLRKILKEHFRRLGENYASAVKTSGMNRDDLEPYLEITGKQILSGLPRGAVVAIGHFGNFELYARIEAAVGRHQRAATYRALKQPKLDALVRRLRDESGCVFFDRRRDGAALRAALNRGGIVLGLLADQHSGSSGLKVPFFGHTCSVTSAPAVFAQRYRLPLHTAICFRAGPARWRIEIGDEIPTTLNGARRPPEEVMADVNAVFETAVRRDPANWLWVHDRWRFSKRRKAERAAAVPCRA